MNKHNLNSFITSLIFLFIFFAIYYINDYGKNPNVQIHVDNLNILV